MLYRILGSRIAGEPHPDRSAAQRHSDEIRKEIPAGGITRGQPWSQRSRCHQTKSLLSNQILKKILGLIIIDMNFRAAQRDRCRQRGLPAAGGAAGKGGYHGSKGEFPKAPLPPQGRGVPPEGRRPCRGQGGTAALQKDPLRQVGTAVMRDSPRRK